MPDTDVLSTELLGDPAACREIGEWMKRVSAGVFDVATVLEGVRIRTQECWCGDTASTLEEHIGQGRQEADELSVEIERAGFAMIAFADGLDTVAARLRQARTTAAEVGLTVTEQGIEPPSTLVPSVQPSTPHQIAAPDTDPDQVRVWTEIHQTVSAARSMELAAHERLAAATMTSRNIFASLRADTGFIATGAASTAQPPPSPRTDGKATSR